MLHNAAFKTGGKFQQCGRGGWGLLGGHHTLPSYTDGSVVRRTISILGFTTNIAYHQSEHLCSSNWLYHYPVVCRGNFVYVRWHCPLNLDVNAKAPG